MSNICNHWIGGRSTADSQPTTRKDSAAELYFENRNPEDGSTICRVRRGTAAVVNQAVEAALMAFKKHRQTKPSDREAWLLESARILQSDSPALCKILVEEVGSPIAKAQREIAAAGGILKSAAGSARRVSGVTYASDIPGRLSYSLREPLGVVAGMTPFNVPLIKCIKHSAMPLATGNAVVLLPSEETPLTALKVAEIYHRAGVPDGLLNVVHGPGEAVGDFLTSHPEVRHVGFTGSCHVGRHVQELCGRHGKRVTLEMGGKNPLVVMEDADLEAALQAAILGAFFYQGQICMASSRILVQAPIFEEFLAKLVQHCQKLTVGELLDPETMIGPIINERQRTRIREHLADATSKGATMCCGGEWDGYRLRPTVLTGVTPEMKMHDEETFGPVTAVTPFDSIDEAIGLANETRFGLSAAIYTARLAEALRFTTEVNAGMVHVNGSTLQEEPHVPFGGVSDSGFGREGTEVAVEDLTEWKWVTINGLS